MEAEEEHKPLLVGRGLLLIDDFCRATGLDLATAESLVRENKVEGLYYTDGRVSGIFDDELPSAAQLRGWGLDVRAEYDPLALRSYVDDSDDPDPGDSEDSPSRGPTWTMEWGDNGP